MKKVIVLLMGILIFTSGCATMYQEPLVSSSLQPAILKEARKTDKFKITKINGNSFGVTNSVVQSGNIILYLLYSPFHMLEMMIPKPPVSIKLEPGKNIVTVDIEGVYGEDAVLEFDAKYGANYTIEYIKKHVGTKGNYRSRVDFYDVAVRIVDENNKIIARYPNDNLDISNKNIEVSMTFDKNGKATIQNMKVVQ